MLPIPLPFVLQRTALDWSDSLWAYRNGLLTWRDLVAIAAQRVAAGSDDRLENELAGVGKDDVWKVSEHAQALAAESPSADSDSKRKWLYLLLAWRYENRLVSEDPLGEVERIYADYDYPAAMEPFVRFMPPSAGWDAKKHSPLENQQRLLTHWKRFLDAESTRYGTEAD